MSSLIDIEYLFKTYYKRLFKVAYNIVGDSSQAEDIVQEVFIHIWKKREELNITSTIEGYLVKSTSNRAINAVLKNKKTTHVEIQDHIEFNLIENSAEINSIDSSLINKLITNSLDLLPPKCRAIFVLSRFENLKNKEIAEKLNISTKTVENQMTIAISKLNANLKPKIKSYFPDFFLLFYFLFFSFRGLI